MLDLDGLSAVNNSHGAAVARTCSHLRRGAAPDDPRRGRDRRTGSDEFSELLHATDAEKAAAWEERFEDMLDACARNLPASPVTCSIGIADTGEASTLMEVAVRARAGWSIQTVRKLRRARETGPS